MHALRTLMTAGAIVAAVIQLSGCVAAGAGAAAGAGVAVYDRRTTGTLVDDEFIEWKALSALSKTEAWEPSHINVTSFNNIVLLTGESPDERLRQQIGDTASRVEKVRRVHNEIRVAAPSSMLSRSSDSLVTGKVKSALLAEKKLEAARVKVVTEAGVTYLMGLVTRPEADGATAIARRIGGVQKVVKLFEYLD